MTRSMTGARHPSSAVIALVVIVSSIGAAGTARAAPPPRVSWQGPPRCQQPPDLLARISALIGVTPAALAGRLVALDASVTRSGERWHMRLELETASGSGERSFSADSCRQLVDGAALIAALAIDPAAVRERRATTRADSGPPPRQRRGNLQLGLRLLGRADLGILPDPAASLGFAAALLWPAFRLELGLAHGLPVEHSPGGGQAGARLRLPLAAELRGCYRRKLSQSGALARFEVDLCLGAALGWLDGEGINIDQPRSGGALWWGALGGGAISARIIKGWFLQIEGRAGASLARPTFEIEGIGEVHRPAMLVGRVGGGVEARLF